MPTGLWLRRIAYAVYASSILAIAGAGVFISPGYAWDTLPYIGVALSYDSNDPAFIHEGAYGAVRRAAPPSVYDELTTSMSYRAEVARDPGAFMEQLPFYRVRVAYCSLIYVLHKAGMDLVRAVFVISALSYVLLTLLGFIWTRRYIGDLGAMLASLLVAYSFPFLQVSRAPGADGLAALAVAFAVYVYVEKQRPALFFALLTLAVLVRHDSVVVGLMFAAYFFLFHRADRLRARAARFATRAGALLGAYLLVDRLIGGYGWRTLFYHTFIRLQSHPATAEVPVGVADYLRVFAHNLADQAPRSFAIPYLLVLALGASFYLRPRERRRLDEPLVTVSIVLILNLVIRPLLFPVLWERFFLAHYLVFAAVSARMLREGSNDALGLRRDPHFTATTSPPAAEPAPAEIQRDVAVL